MKFFGVSYKFAYRVIYVSMIAQHLICKTYDSVFNSGCKKEAFLSKNLSSKENAKEDYLNMKKGHFYCGETAD